MKDWNVLKDREIINLIIGDKTVGDDWFYQFTMPYMKGQDICEFSSNLGFHQDYYKDERKSRFKYMENLIDYVIKKNMINTFFKELIKLKRFRSIDISDSFYDANTIYWKIVNGLFSSINRILFFEECHLEYDLDAYEFTLVDDNKKLSNYKIKNKQLRDSYIVSEIDKVYSGFEDMYKFYCRFIHCSDSAVLYSTNIIEEQKVEFSLTTNYERFSKQCLINANTFCVISKLVLTLIKQFWTEMDKGNRLNK